MSDYSTWFTPGDCEQVVCPDCSGESAAKDYYCGFCGGTGHVLERALEESNG